MARQGFRRDPAKERLWRRAITRWGKCDLNVREFCGQEGLSQGDLDFSVQKVLTEKSNSPLM